MTIALLLVVLCSVDLHRPQKFSENVVDAGRTVDE